MTGPRIVALSSIALAALDLFALWRLRASPWPRPWLPMLGAWFAVVAIVLGLVAVLT